MSSSKRRSAAPHRLAAKHRLTGADYLLYLRCPRSLHHRLIGEESTRQSTYTVSSDRDAVYEVGRRLFSKERTGESEMFSAEWVADPFVARPDVRHTIKPEGHASVLIREATGLKRAYLGECAFIRYCSERSGHGPDRQFVYYVDKSYRRSGELDPDAFFVRADVTRRVDSIYESEVCRIEELAGDFARDPTLSTYAEQLCKRPHTCPICSSDAEPLGDDHVLTLCRGGGLARELLSEGYTSILEVPDHRLKHRRQHIQKASLKSREPYVDAELLSKFLSSLEYPIYYLDFEAVTSAVPPFDGIRPWEHVPYLYSIHVQDSPLKSLSHHWFICDPGRDDRVALLNRLLADLGTSGSIVVYSEVFELSVLARLAEQFPVSADSVEKVRERVVDLLEPFNEFAYYHHAQRGKVSLKSVLPAITEHDYSGLVINGGLDANLAYRHLSENRDVHDRERILDDLVAYCAMDTMAMVHIVARLRAVSDSGANSVEPPQDI